MPVFVLAVVALALFLVMGVLFATAILMEKRQRRLMAEPAKAVVKDAEVVVAPGMSRGAGK